MSALGLSFPLDVLFTLKEPSHLCVPALNATYVFLVHVVVWHRGACSSAAVHLGHTKKNVEQKRAAASGHIEISASHIENIALKCIQTCIHLCVGGGTCVCTNIYVYIDMRSQAYLTIDN